MGNQKSKCPFCEVVETIYNEPNEDSTDNDRVLSYNDKYAIFPDKHPAAKHHYLVVPRKHINNPKTLEGEEHAKMVEEMYGFGKQYLESLDTAELATDARYGFHFPPFISIEHLHLHVICPASSMNFTHTNLFRENTWYFLSPPHLAEVIRQKGSRV
ncbi:adenosine 5'-monophosphoramidase HINT3-like [Clavelina lepadiformis]|uniref:adenosine 5'-monophosphoramidase HINT3-like n=1 Tax=Clavelina lepadiformis TaxID=159417 RepID=UPI004042180F